MSKIINSLRIGRCLQCKISNENHLPNPFKDKRVYNEIRRQICILTRIMKEKFGFQLNLESSR